MTQAKFLSFLLLVSLVWSGCGSSGQDFVSTGTGAGNSIGSGTLVFNFVRNQQFFVVPLDTVGLSFVFYDEPNQQGAETLVVSRDFANTIVIENVPTNTRSYLIVARTAEGLPLAEIRGEVFVLSDQSATVDPTEATITPVTLSSVLLNPGDVNVEEQQTQQFTLSGSFSNGENLNLPSAIFQSDNPLVASIDPETGLATAGFFGTAVITGTFDSQSDSAEMTVVAGDVSATLIDLFVSDNGDNAGVLDVLDRLNNLRGSFSSGGNQGIVVDSTGTGFHNSDDGNVVTPDPIYVLNRVADRLGSTLDPQLDRRIIPPSGLGLKGSTIAAEQGFLISADFVNSALVVVGTAGTQVESSTTPSQPWDVAYDETSDRLFVAFVDGTLGVYDTWIANDFPGAPDRTITVTGLDNAHGIAYDEPGDRLLVSDVGTQTTGPNDSDGEVYVLPNASTSNGNVVPDLVITGPNTLLGNPVDIDLRGPDLRVAEKANQQILIFSDIFNSSGGDLPPTLSTADSTPESIFSQELTAPPVDSTDVVPATPLLGVLVSTETSVVRLDLDLTAVENEFSPSFATNNFGRAATADSQGDIFFFFFGEDTDTSGFQQLGRLATGVRDGDSFTNVRDRESGPTSGELLGLDIVDSLGYLIVADSQESEIEVLSKNGNGSPIFSTATSLPPGSLDYDPESGDLYVSFPEGTIEIYRDYFAGNPNLAVPDVQLTIQGGPNLSLSGMVHDAASDSLIVTDSAQDSTDDGRIYVFLNVSTLTSGPVTPDIDINGASTMLQDPLGIAFDGVNLYVVEPVNSLILRFDDILASAGGDVPPSVVNTDVNEPLSVSLIVGAP